MSSRNGEAHTSGRAPDLSARTAALVLLAASLVMIAVLAYVGRWLTFWSDEWNWLFRRPDPSVLSLLGGSDVHLHLFPVLIYQTLFRVVGLSNYYPYLMVSWALHLACVWLLFAITGRLAGWGFGLVAGLSLLFLGSGFEVLLQPGQMGYALSEATGLLALFWLMPRPGAESPGLRRVGAALALLVAVASSGVGMFFVGLIVLWAAMRRDRARLLPALPALVLFAVWFPIFAVRTMARLEWAYASLLQVPAYIAYGIGATVSAVSGLPPYRFALVGAVLAAAAVVIVLLLGGRFDALALAALAALCAEFALVAGFRPSFGIAWTARSGYLHPAAALLWLVAASVWADPRLRLRSWLRPWMVAGLVTLAILGNMMQFAGAARGMRLLRADEVAYLRLLEALRDSPDLDRGARAMFRISADRYLAAIDRFGAPRLASWEPSLTDLGPVDRSRLDRALVTLLGPGIRPLPEAQPAGASPAVAVVGGLAEPAGASCVRVAAGPTRAKATWTPATGAFALESSKAGALGAVRLGAFARPGQAIEPAAPAEGRPRMGVRLPPLPAGLRWSVAIEVAAGEAVTICGAPPG